MKYGIPFMETNMVKWSGSLVAMLCINWNYALARDEYASKKDREVFVPDKPCMIWSFRRLGIDGLSTGAASELLMIERWFHAEVVPPRNKCWRKAARDTTTLAPGFVATVISKI
jgi:hypothetical protein